MPKPRPEAQHDPVGFSDEVFPTSPRWILALVFALSTLGAGIALAVRLWA